MTDSRVQNEFYAILPLLFGFCFFAAVFCAVVPPAEAQPGVAGLSREDALKLGERMYRHGVLPSGKPITAIVNGDVPVDGTMFTCQSCHLRSGLGSYEGGVLTPAVNGGQLYQPKFEVRRTTAADKRKIPSYLLPLYEAPPNRPAYTDKTLATALSEGVDSGGKELHPVMPRYVLGDRDMAILIYYLKSLSTEPSPGVTDTTIRFATVVTDDVTPEERAAVLTPIEKFVRGRNSQARTFETRARYGTFAETMALTYRSLALTVWDLHGPPETWRGQLEAYYRKEPVFAILGGITGGEWRPVHEFSEEHGIPCILPITDYPVISKTDWYTLYFSKGFYQEGEAVAHFLATAKMNLSPDKTVLQISLDNREGQAFATGFQKTWQSIGRRPAVNSTLKAGEAITKEFIQQLLNKEKPSVLLLWAGPEAASALKMIAEQPNRPEMIYLSSTLLKENFAGVPEQVREFTYFTYPYGLAAGGVPYKFIKGSRQVSDRGVQAKMLSFNLTLGDAIMMMKGDFYRDRFLEVIDMLEDRVQPYTNYERLSFGPGQRYAAKGCYIMQLSDGDSPHLVKKSDWVIN